MIDCVASTTRRTVFALAENDTFCRRARSLESFGHTNTRDERSCRLKTPSKSFAALRGAAWQEENIYTGMRHGYGCLRLKSE